MSSGQINNENYYWWKAKKGETHKHVFQYVDFVCKNQQYRHYNNFKYLRLYSNYDVLDMQAYAYMQNDATAGTKNQVTFNVIQSMVDTVTSKITKNKPKPTFLTEGGDFSQQQRAKRLSQFVEGQFYSTKFYEKSAQAFKDSCITGTGVVKIFNRDGEMQAERVFSDEIIVDDTESIYGEPRQMHQYKWMHKDVLMEMFPKKKAEIETAASDKSNSTNLPYMQNPDMILTIESWHLPASSKAKDGKHTICISNADLHVEDWTKDYFPFIFWRWNKRSLGFFGQGLAEQLQGLQLEINKILRTIQVSMHLVSIPKIYLEASSKIVTAHLDNKIGGIIRYAGTKPDNGPVAQIPPDLFDHLDRLYTRAYDIAGISELSATSKKPSGLDSGKALREYNDIETERFMEVGQRWEQTFLDAADIFISEVREIVQNSDENPEVTVKGKKFIDKIKWSDVDMDRDKYEMHVFPTSALSSTPAGRLQDVQEMMQAGLISTEEGRGLLDFPDLKAFNDLKNAPIDDIMRTIEEITEKGNYQTPEPYQNLEYGVTKMQEAYLYYRTQDLSEKRLEMMRRWMEEADALIKKANDALNPPAPQPMMPPELGPVTDPALAAPMAVPPAVPGLEAPMPVVDAAPVEPTAEEAALMAANADTEIQ